MTPKVGILHPGQMGVSIAASALAGGCEVFWPLRDGAGRRMTAPRSMA